MKMKKNNKMRKSKFYNVIINTLFLNSFIVFSSGFRFLMNKAWNLTIIDAAGPAKVHHQCNVVVQCAARKPILFRD